MDHHESAITTLDWLRRTAEEVLGIPPEKLHRDTGLAALGLDSLAQLQIVLLAERELNARIPDSALTEANLLSLETLASTIDRHRC